MNNKFDELTKGSAQSVTRRAGLKKFGVALAGTALAYLGLASKPALAQPTGPGSALSFDGSMSYVAIATTGSLKGTFTVELWAKPAATDIRALVSSRFLTQEFGFDFGLGAWLPNGGIRIHGDIGNGVNWVTTFADADYPYSTGTWHHIAYVVTPSVYTIYANGVLVGRGAVS